MPRLTRAEPIWGQAREDDRSRQGRERLAPPNKFVHTGQLCTLSSPDRRRLATSVWPETVASSEMRIYEESRINFDAIARPLDNLSVGIVSASDLQRPLDCPRTSELSSQQQAISKYRATILASREPPGFAEILRPASSLRPAEHYSLGRREQSRQGSGSPHRCDPGGALDACGAISKYFSHARPFEMPSNIATVLAIRAPNLARHSDC